MEAELAAAESSVQIIDKFGAEQATEHFDWKKALPPTREPAALVGRDSTAGDDAMEVWMMQAARTIP